MADVKWIKIVTDIFDDEKILMIETMPEADSIIVIWFKLLCLAGKQNNSGVFMLHGNIPYTDEMFAAVFRRNVQTVQLALQTFEKYGMIEIVNGAVTIPNWGKHQALDRLEAHNEYMRNYMQRYREKQKALATTDESGETNGESNSNTNSATNGYNSKTNSKPNSKANVSTLDKNKSKTRLDKTRLDNSTVCGELSHETSPPAAEQPAEPPLYALPLNDGSEYGFTEKDVDSYRSLYPAVDIDQEFRKMLGWLNANPGKRKTRRGIRNFVNNWLSREQDKGGAHRPVYYTPDPLQPPQPPPQQIADNPWKR